MLVSLNNSCCLVQKKKKKKRRNRRIPGSEAGIKTLAWILLRHYTDPNFCGTISYKAHSVAARFNFIWGIYIFTWRLSGSFFYLWAVSPGRMFSERIREAKPEVFLCRVGVTQCLPMMKPVVRTLSHFLTAKWERGWSAFRSGGAAIFLFWYFLPDISRRRLSSRKCWIWSQWRFTFLSPSPLAPPGLHPRCLRHRQGSHLRHLSILHFICFLHLTYLLPRTPTASPGRGLAGPLGKRAAPINGGSGSALNIHLKALWTIPGCCCVCVCVCVWSRGGAIRRLRYQGRAVIACMCVCVSRKVKATLGEVVLWFNTQIPLEMNISGGFPLYLTRVQFISHYDRTRAHMHHARTHTNTEHIPKSKQLSNRQIDKRDNSLGLCRSIVHGEVKIKR